MNSEILKKAGLALSAIVFSLIIVFAALELFLRISGSNTLHGLYRSHLTRRYQHIPFADNGTYQINSKGLRDYEYSYRKSGNAFRVICLGDSITFGQGVTLEDTYIKQLEELEYVYAVIGRKGKEYIYELLITEEVRETKPFLVGLADIEQLKEKASQLGIKDE